MLSLVLQEGLEESSEEGGGQAGGVRDSVRGEEEGGPRYPAGGGRGQEQELAPCPLTPDECISRATLKLRQLGSLPPCQDPLRTRRAKYSTFDRRKGAGGDRRGVPSSLR